MVVSGMRLGNETQMIQAFQIANYAILFQSLIKSGGDTMKANMEPTNVCDFVGNQNRCTTEKFRRQRVCVSALQS